MIRHTKHRCQININPTKTKITSLKQYQNEQSQSQFSNRQSSKLKTQETDESFDQPSHKISDQYSCSPFNRKMKRSYIDISTHDRTFTPNSNQFFDSRGQIYSSSIIQSSQTKLPPFASQRTNQRKTHKLSKSIVLNDCVSQFSFQQNNKQRERSVSTQIKRLREQNQQLRRLLNQKQSNNSCCCNNPYLQQQLQYLRENVYDYYSKKSLLVKSQRFKYMKY